MPDRPCVLILGGTAEALELTRAIADLYAATYSLAGRTRSPALPEGAAARSGGFGGVDSLAEWLRSNAVDALVDAAHPFAARISANAAEAAARAGVPRLKLLRPAWTERPGDRWRHAGDAAAAAAALKGGTAFLSIGRRGLEAFSGLNGVRFVVRTVEPLKRCPFPNAIADRGPFTVEGEIALMKRYGVDTLVSKNAGGNATYAKILAARTLRLPVVMIARPDRPPGDVVESAAAAADWLRRRLKQRSPEARRSTGPGAAGPTP